MRKLFNIKSAVMTLACTFALALATTTVVTDASTITEKPDPDVYTVGVGSTTSFSGTNVKINKKKPKTKKLKKKIKVVNYKNSPKGASFTNMGSAYFKDSAAYPNENAYTNATSYDQHQKYKATASYDVQFKKTGTYKITYDSYSQEYISYESKDSKSYDVFYIEQGADRLFLKNGSFQKIDISDAELFEDVDDSDCSYYKSINGTIVDSFWNSDTYESYYAFATVSTDEDGYKYTVEKPGSAHFSRTSFYRETVYFYKESDKNGTYYFKGNNWSKVASDQADEFVRKYTVDTDETYYQSATGVIFAYGNENTYVRASLQTGADKKVHVKYNPANIVKTINTRTYRVVKKNTAPIASITLGKAKYTRADSYAASGKSSYKSTSQRFLSGGNGKLAIKTNKGYSIQSVIVKTYDAKGNVVFQQSKNKGNVTFGDFKSGYTNEDGTFSHSLYKPTTVYVNYKNKADGDYTRAVVENLRYADGTPYQRLKIYTGYHIKDWKNNNPGKQYVCEYDSTCADHTPHYHSLSDADWGCTDTYTFYKK